MYKPNFGKNMTMIIPHDDTVNSRINHVGRNEQIDACRCPNFGDHDQNKITALIEKIYENLVRPKEYDL